MTLRPAACPGRKKPCRSRLKALPLFGKSAGTFREKPCNF